MGATDELFPMSLQQAANTEAILGAITGLVAVKGIDTASAVLAEFFPDDNSFYFGILVTRGGQVYQFGYDYLNQRDIEGTLSEWEDLTESWQSSIYGEEIGRPKVCPDCRLASACMSFGGRREC